MSKPFPRTEVSGISLPRMLIGTNWMLGWSHRSVSADKKIKEQFAKPADFYPILSAFLEYGINAVMGPLSGIQIIMDGIEYTRQKTGKDI